MFWDRKKYLESNPYLTEKECPFCKLYKDEEKLLVTETKHWTIRYNKYPYFWDKHLMSIPKKHKIYTTELSSEELEDYKNVEQYMKEYYKSENNYFSFIRQTTWWRSIEHLHYHYLPGHISFDEKSKENIFKIKNK